MRHFENAMGRVSGRRLQERRRSTAKLQHFEIGVDDDSRRAVSKEHHLIGALLKLLLALELAP